MWVRTLSAQNLQLHATAVLRSPICMWGEDCQASLSDWSTTSAPNLILHAAYRLVPLIRMLGGGLGWSGTQWGVDPTCCMCCTDAQLLCLPFERIICNGSWPMPWAGLEPLMYPIEGYW
jgi:hypothetical protein